MRYPVLLPDSLTRRIQQVAFKVILGDEYHDYNVACTLLDTETLEMRRVKLYLKFGRKDIKSETALFNVILNPGRTRDKSRLVHEYKCNTKRFQNSSLPYCPYFSTNSNELISTQ